MAIRPNCLDIPSDGCAIASKCISAIGTVGRSPRRVATDSPMLNRQCLTLGPGYVTDVGGAISNHHFKDSREHPAGVEMGFGELPGGAGVVGVVRFD